MKRVEGTAAHTATKVCPITRSARGHHLLARRKSVLLVRAVLQTLPVLVLASCMATVRAAAGVNGRSVCVGLQSPSRTNICGSPAVRAGRGLGLFAQKLSRLSRGSTVKILVIGNSVARWNNLLTSRTFRDVLQRCQPAVRFQLISDSRTVEGGFDSTHMLHCGKEAWDEADIILVHMAELAQHHNGRSLLRVLLSLAHQPLVLVIKHCALVQFEVLVNGAPPASADSLRQAVWLALDKHHTTLLSSASGIKRAIEHAEYQSQCERSDLKVAMELNVSIVDSCSLLRAQLTDPTHGCEVRSNETNGISWSNRTSLGRVPASSDVTIADVRRVATRMFPYNPVKQLADPLHPSEAYCRLQGSAAANLVALHMRAELPSAITPAAALAPTAGEDRGRPLLPMELSSSGQTDLLSRQRDHGRLPSSFEVAKAEVALWDQAETGTGGRSPGTTQGSRKGSLLADKVTGRLAKGPSQVLLNNDRAGATTGPDGSSNLPALDALPPALQPWCLRMGDELWLNRALIVSDGWTVQIGGAGGQKRWLQAQEVGAFVDLAVPITTPRLTMEFYKHDTLPLGMLRATVTWRLTGGSRLADSFTGGAHPTPGTHKHIPIHTSVVTLDGRCRAADHCPTGQGFYHRAVLADFSGIGLLDLTAPAPANGSSRAQHLSNTPEPKLDAAAPLSISARVRLTVIPRDDGQSGSQFSIATIVAE